MFSVVLIRFMAFIAFLLFVYACICIYYMISDLIKRRGNPDLPQPTTPMQQMKSLARTYKRIKQAEEESEQETEFEPKYYSEIQRIEWNDFSDIDKFSKS